MNWLERLERYIEHRQIYKYGSDPRPMTEEEFNVLKTQERYTRNRTTGDVRKAIQMRNPVRWRRLQRELRWARKQMVKMKLNPDDLRWIL